jgi:hypothetical protein
VPLIYLFGEYMSELDPDPELAEGIPPLPVAEAAGKVALCPRTSVRVWLPAAYPDEAPIVDGFTLRSTPPKLTLLSVCKALETEIGARHSPELPLPELELGLRLEPEPEPDPDPEPEPEPGSEISGVAYDALVAGYTATQTLGLTDEAFERLTNAGLREVAAICQPWDGLRAVVFPEKLKQRAGDGLTELLSLHPSAHFVCVGDDITLKVRTAAVEAKIRLDSLQEQLQSASMAELVPCAARDEARLAFVVAAEAYSAALAEGSALAGHVDWLSKQGAVSKWRHAQAEAKQLALLAAECKWVVQASEPEQSTKKLAELQEKDRRNRQAMKTSQAYIDIAEGEVAASPRASELGEIQSTPAQRQARSVLLEPGMSSWSEEQVQEWIGLLGLSLDDTAAVQKALTADNTDGEDLEGYSTETHWTRRLKKSGVENAAELAEQTMALHTAALGETPAQRNLLAAQEEFARARKALRENSTAMRQQLTKLVILASQHFPELLSHEDVKMFMGSDGLHVSDRQLADYDERRLIVRQVWIAKFDGIEVILKQFPLKGDMRGYMREITNVQRLNHRNIIRYNAVFESEGSMYIEMEFSEQGSLIQWMRAAKRDEAQKQSVLQQVLLALACIHEQRIVHCDIKGDNVLIAADGTACICDFEMSKHLGGVSMSSTMIGGTLGFIAPEVKDRKQKHSPASDMYSFGVLMLNVLHLPAPADYPLTDASVAADLSLRKLVVLLMHDDPARRPTALQLQAEPYFDVVKATEQRVHDAEAAAARQVAQVQAQKVKAQAAEAKANDAAAIAVAYLKEAEQAVIQAQQARQDNAQQAAEARSQIARAQEAELQSNAAAEAAATREQDADAEIARAQEAERQVIAAADAEVARAQAAEQHADAAAKAAATRQQQAEAAAREAEACAEAEKAAAEKAAAKRKLPAGKRHVLQPVRDYDPTSAEQVHYRMAESQFLRMAERAGRASKTTITQIEYYVDTKLERAFEAKKREYDRAYGAAKHQTRLAFHGTKSASIDSIMSGGFRLDKVGSATDSGWYGAGIYFSEQTAYSQAYDRAGGRLILCQLLLGKPCALTSAQRCDGVGCKPGYTSHVVNDGAEVVIFDMAAILPTYIVHYRR